MELEKSIEMLDALAQGIDPVTGEVLPNTSPYNNVEITRALFIVTGYIKDLPKSKKPKKSVAEKQQENISNGLPKNAGLSWTDEEREQIKRAFQQGSSSTEIAESHERTDGAIRSELKKLGLIEKA